MGMPGLRLAVGMLTVIPVRPPEELKGGAAMLWAPVAVVPVAVLAALAGWGAAQLVTSPLAGVVAVAVVALATRAMHLDGLADLTDGLGSGKPATQALEIMRRGDVGPMGVVALVLALMAESLAAGEIVTRPWGWVQLAVLLCVSRGALAPACLPVVPAARPDGLGALVAGRVPQWAAVLLWLALTGSAIAAGLLVGQPWWLPLIAVVLTLVVVAGLVRRAVRRLGGITGDVLGALVEVAAALLLVAGAVRP